MKVEVQKIGESTAVILPEEIFVRLNAAPGGYVHAIANGNGSFDILPNEHKAEKIDETNSDNPSTDAD